MPVSEDRDAAQRLAATFRDEWPRLVATVMRLVGDLQTAEDVVQDVLVAALDRWPLAGVPASPAAWLMTACRNRARNVLRDAGRADHRTTALAPLLALGDDAYHPPAIEDDRLRLIFICCHPVLPVDARVALTLRMVGGLSTVEIARAWHVPTATMAQRVVRAKRTLAEARVPFEEPTGQDLADRLPAVLDVVYLIFNEGYLASSGDQLTRAPLAAEAHRLARLLTDLLPGQPGPWALRALIAFHRSRDAARTDPAGDLVSTRNCSPRHPTRSPRSTGPWRSPCRPARTGRCHCWTTSSPTRPWPARTGCGRCARICAAEPATTAVPQRTMTARSRWSTTRSNGRYLADMRRTCRTDDREEPC